MVKKIDGFTEKGIMLRERFSISMLIKFAIIFALSLVLFYASNNEVLSAFFGFVMIITGSLILLFILIYLIFFFIERMDGPKKAELVKSNKKSVTSAKPKKTTKVIAKKAVKKKVLKKPAKKTAKKKSKK